MNEHIEDHKKLYDAARSLRKTGMSLTWRANEIAEALEELVRLRHIVASGIAVSINQENKELRYEVDCLKRDLREMTKFKEHMVELREAHGFDSWAAALVEVDKLKAENEHLKTTGFGDAFYQVADRLGVTGARPASPMQVFTSEVLPALDKAIKDSERYRWLRDPDRCEEDYLDGPADNIVVGSCGGEDILWSAELDSAIDAAMGKGDQP